MDEQARFDMVRHSPLGVELTEEQCRVLAATIETHALKDGDILIREGHVDNRLYVIVEGMLAVVREISPGEWVTLHILKTGDLAGEMGFVDGMEHSATLRSIGNTQVFSLEREAFESLIPEHPFIVYRVMRAIIRSVHAIVHRMNTQFVELTNYITKQHGRY